MTEYKRDIKHDVQVLKLKQEKLVTYKNILS